jgi:hypothetical protein
MAVSDLKSGLGGPAVGHRRATPASEIDKRIIQEITEDLQRAFQKYQQAERTSWARWAEAA